jgi:putative ABC transport system permease protein
METFWQDLRYGVRALAQTPAFTIVAILTLGLGIGANAATFSVTRAVLLSPLPYADTERTVAIWSRWADFDKTWVSEAELLDYRRTRSLRDVGAWSTTQVNLTGANAEPERVGAARVTPNVFTALGARPLHGRTFTPDEEVEGRDTVAILGHGLWQRRFGGDHLVLHRRIRVDGRDLTVVGIMPQGFQLPTDYGEDFAEPTELWIPLTVNPSSPERGNHGWYAAARLAPGVTIAQANEELRAITAARAKAHTRRRCASGRLRCLWTTRSSEPCGRGSCCWGSPWASSCSSRAPMSRACCSRGRRDASAKWR